MSSPSCAPSQNFKPKDSVVYHHVSPFFHGCFDLFGISSTPWCMVYTPRTSFSRPASLLAAPVCSLAEICCTSQGAAPNIPSGNLTVCHKELPICRWFTSWIWPYSMATFNNHGVNHFMEARHTSTGNSYLDLRQKRAVPIEKKYQRLNDAHRRPWARGLVGQGSGNSCDACACCPRNTSATSTSWCEAEADIPSGNLTVCY